MMYDKHSTEIKAVISDYFNGIYNGDATLLEDIFHKEALLFGDIQGDTYFKTAPESLGEDYKIRTF